ncbi:lysozyme family protein [Gottfriedia sp. NPDC056225]|uniref:lysozyme family protein n=1 Tax=Gottfriedia sp. NPDC056225 TaxID=3345751 RepID=UPI001558F20C|nr:lysozyme family protein [Arthrobacter citreus]
MLKFIKRLLLFTLLMAVVGLFAIYRYYFQGVLKYESQVYTELKTANLEEYTPLLLGLMMQETKGKGKDPMQASESLGLAKDSIQDTSKSVQQGVAHFKDVYSYGKKQGVDLATIIQSYNMGIAYINFVKMHGGKHTKQLAKTYSLSMVDTNPELYTCNNNKKNFRYPYCYGDFTYSEKVMKKAKYFEILVPLKHNIVGKP